jgi:hypothetical protein
MLPFARMRVPRRANPPEKSRKGVAQQVPFSDYGYSETIETLKSGPSEPLFRGGLEIDDSAFQPDGDGMGAIVSV